MCSECYALLCFPSSSHCATVTSSPRDTENRCVLCTNSLTREKLGVVWRTFCSEECGLLTREICDLLDIFPLDREKLDSCLSNTTDLQRNHVVNALQKLIDYPDSPHRHSTRSLLAEWMQRTSCFPSAIVLKDITGISQLPDFSGTFTDTFCGTYSGTKVALKRLIIDHTLPASSRQHLFEKFHREVALWRNLDHEYVLQCFGSSGAAFERYLTIVCPWVPNGNVRAYIDQHKDFLELNWRLPLWLHQVALGLQYLHSQGVIHGHLCGRNILLDSDCNVRLADFGITSFADNEPYDAYPHRNYLVPWLAPELFVPGNVTSIRRFTRESDVFAFGAVIIEVFTNRDPENTLELDGNQDVVAKPPSPHGTLVEIPPHLQRLAAECYLIDPQLRPSALQVCLSTAPSDDLLSTAAGPFGRDTIKPVIERLGATVAVLDTSFSEVYNHLKLQHRLEDHSGDTLLEEWCFLYKNCHRYFASFHNLCVDIRSSGAGTLLPALELATTVWSEGEMKENTQEVVFQRHSMTITLDAIERLLGGNRILLDTLAQLAPKIDRTMNAPHLKLEGQTWRNPRMSNRWKRHLSGIPKYVVAVSLIAGRSISRLFPFGRECCTARSSQQIHASLPIDSSPVSKSLHNVQENLDAINAILQYIKTCTVKEIEWVTKTTRPNLHRPTIAIPPFHSYESLRPRFHLTSHGLSLLSHTVHNNTLS
ncbi:unnamed protein product [Somion occarium]|uniref:Protein kinase domain-containing protein n=1 Tax=Somion occarium TaxID=3059160 RepID=A0ABP1E8P6_9APHY